jgi:hypothetical protein
MDTDGRDVPPESTESTGSTGSAEAVARAYLAALGGDDPDSIAALVDVAFRNEHLSALGEGSTGRASYRDRLPAFLATFPERAYRVLDLVAVRRGPSTDVVVRYELHAVHHDASALDTGEPGATAPVRVVVPGIMWLTVADGLVAGRVDCWDALTFLRQSGGSDPGRSGRV